MLLPILLLTVILRLTNADTLSTPKQGFEDLEKLVETRMQEESEKQAKGMKELEAKIKEMEAKEKEMETRLSELEERLKEDDDTLEEIVRECESKLRKEVEKESLSKKADSDISNNALTNPSLRDLPIVLISAWRSAPIYSPETVTFKSFLANYNNGGRPGGGDGELDLDSGVFTCFTPGYYQVSFSAEGIVGPDRRFADMSLYKNGSTRLRESLWHIGIASGALNDNVAMVGSRILILHLDAGDTLELRVEYVYNIS